jgi:hypothetical protein
MARRQQVYTVAIQWLGEGPEKQATYSVPDYEVKDGVLTLAIDRHHDVVIPLFQVVRVDIERQE